MNDPEHISLGFGTASGPRRNPSAPTTRLASGRAEFAFRPELGRAYSTSKRPPSTAQLFVPVRLKSFTNRVGHRSLASLIGELIRGCREVQWAPRWYIKLQQCYFRKLFFRLRLITVVRPPNPPTPTPTPPFSACISK
jgi:hypothetical protein